MVGPVTWSGADGRGGGSRRARPAAERLQDVAVLVLGLLLLAALGVVVLDVPERQLGETTRRRPPFDGPCVRDRERLGLAVVIDAKVLADTDHAPQLRGGLTRIQLVQPAEQLLRRALGVVGHLVRKVVVVVERHDVDHGDLGADGDGVLQHDRAALVDSGRVGRDGVDELHGPVRPGGPPLHHHDGLVPPVDARVIVQRVFLGVEVEAGEVISGDHLLVLGRYLPDAVAAVGQFFVDAVGGRAAKGRHYLAAGPLDSRDAGRERLADRRLGIAVPVDGARARLGGLQERQGQVAGAGRLGRGGERARTRGVVRREYVRRQQAVMSGASGARRRAHCPGAAVRGRARWCRGHRHQPGDASQRADSGKHTRPQHGSASSRPTHPAKRYYQETFLISAGLSRGRAGRVRSMWPGAPRT